MNYSSELIEKADELLELCKNEDINLFELITSRMNKKEELKSAIDYRKKIIEGVSKNINDFLKNRPDLNRNN